METTTPLDPRLKPAYLTAIATEIRRAAHTAVRTHQPALGDNPWTMGCVRYQRICHALEALATSGTAKWLRVHDEQPFMFSIDGVPLRFYRGEPEEPTTRTLRRHYDELRALELAFPGFNVDADAMLRLAYETDDRGEVIRASVVQVGIDGTPQCTWAIMLAPVMSRRTRKAAIQLPHPSQAVAAADTRTADHAS